MCGILTSHQSFVQIFQVHYSSLRVLAESININITIKNLKYMLWNLKSAMMGKPGGFKTQRPTKL